MGLLKERMASRSSGIHLERSIAAKDIWYVYFDYMVYFFCLSCVQLLLIIIQTNKNNNQQYIDRIGYRIPTKLAESIGKKQLMNDDKAVLNNRRTQSLTQQSSTTSGKKAIPTKKRPKKCRPIQRSLTPHLDCCPESYHDATDKSKWRPIQCFVSLTDNLQPNTGGFEAVSGFHREFSSWVQNGRRLRESSTTSLDECDAQSTAPQCVGEYTHLSPSHDRGLLWTTGKCV